MARQDLPNWKNYQWYKNIGSNYRPVIEQAMDYYLDFEPLLDPTLRDKVLSKDLIMMYRTIYIMCLNMCHMEDEANKLRETVSKIRVPREKTASATVTSPEPFILVFDNVNDVRPSIMFEQIMTELKRRQNGG